MITDNATLFASLEALPNGAATSVTLGGNTITNVAATPYSIDLAQLSNPIGIGIDDLGKSEMELAVHITTSFTTTSPLATVEWQIVSFPINPAVLTAATTSGALATASLTPTIATSIFTTPGGTPPAHNLQLGTPIYFSAVGTVTTPAANTLYYVVPASATTFKLATSYANALAGTTVTFAGTAVACTTVFYPTVVATTGAIPTVFLKAGARFLGTSAQQHPIAGGRLVAPFSGATPQPLGSAAFPATFTGGGANVAANVPLTRVPGRYLALQVIMAGAASDTTGRYTAAFGKDLTNALAFYPSGLEVR